MAEGTSAPGGNPPDGLTIIENQKGEIQAQNVKKVFGDFENNSKGDWTNYNSPDSVAVINSGADSGNYHLEVANFNAKTAGVEKTVNLDGVETLVWYYQIAEGGSFTGTSNDSLELVVDGVVEVSQSGGSSTSWKKAEIDVSSKSGDVVLKCQNSNTSGNNFHTSFDLIQQKEYNLSQTLNADGAGGV